MNRAFSFGGGRQSTAALVLAARGELDVDCFVFANVGDDSENPDTLAYIRDYSRPYAEGHGIELIEIQRKFKDGRDPSLYQYVLNAKRAVPIPMRMSLSGAPGNRTCTYDWKILVVWKYLKRERGWVPPWELALGISWDESHRMHDGTVQRKSDANPEFTDYRKVYPLCDMRLTVADCKRIVAEASLPEPPKSSCWFCPFHDSATWARQRLHRPDLFDAALGMERRVNQVREDIGKDPVYFSTRLKPLDVAVPEGADQLEMFDAEDACTSGYCWT